MSLAIYVQAITPILPVAAAKDPIGRAFGWGSRAARVTAPPRLSSRDDRRHAWLGGDRYQEAAELALPTARAPNDVRDELVGRANQYDLWPRFPDLARPGDNLVLVLDESTEPHAAFVRLTPYFAAMRAA